MPSFKAPRPTASRVFFRTAEPLTADDTDSAEDIYERAGPTTTLISTGPDDGPGSAGPVFGGASADGTRVFFRTQESLIDTDTDTRHRRVRACRSKDES